MKPVINSKTIGFFVLYLVMLVANYYGYADFIPEEAFGELGILIVSVVGIILRFVTNKEIRGLLKS